MSQLGFELPRSGREGGERPKRETLCRADVPRLLHIQFIDQDEAVASLCNARPSPGMRDGSEKCELIIVTVVSSGCLAKGVITFAQGFKKERDGSSPCSCRG